MPRRKQDETVTDMAAAITPELASARRALNGVIDTDAITSVGTGLGWTRRLVSPLERMAAHAVSAAADRASDDEDDEDDKKPAAPAVTAAKVEAPAGAPAKTDEALAAMVAKYQDAVRSDNEMTEFRAREEFYRFLKERGNDDYFARKAIVDRHQETAFEFAVPARPAAPVQSAQVRMMPSVSAALQRAGSRIAEEAPEDLTPLRKGEKPTLSWILGRSQKLRLTVRHFNADYGSMQPDERAAAQEGLLAAILEHCPDQSLAAEFARDIVTGASKDIVGHERARGRAYAHSGVSNAATVVATFPRPVGFAAAAMPQAPEKSEELPASISPKRMQELNRGRPILKFAMKSFIRCYASATDEHRASMVNDITGKLRAADATEPEVTAIITYLKEQACSERHAGLGRK